MKNILLAVVATLVTTLTGCAEGPLWKAGGYLPWVRAKWAQEEQIAETVHAKKSRLRALAKRAKQLSEAEKEQTVANLAPFIENEKIIQLRVDAIYALGEINSQSAENVVIRSLKDPEAEVRIAAVNALTQRRTQTAGQELIRVTRSDTDKDVRTSAIRGLSSYPGDATVAALGQILNEPEPALQFAAMESLDAVTGSSIGINVTKWKERLASLQNGATQPNY